MFQKYIFRRKNIKCLILYTQSCIYIAMSSRIYPHKAFNPSFIQIHRFTKVFQGLLNIYSLHVSAHPVCLPFLLLLDLQIYLNFNILPRQTIRPVLSAVAFSQSYIKHSKNHCVLSELHEEHLCKRAARP